ncbi:MAG TPA: DUF4325 domain-containing protein [Gammaproteobacteria bacterium]|nr:DUF4325 domain-containing protein [Gammaproteobacteria bacterium]
MRNQSEQIKAFVVANVADHPTDIVKITAEKFSTTIMTVHRHIHSLIKADIIVKLGNTRNTKYFLRNEYERLKIYTITSNIAEDQIIKEFNDIFIRLPKNIYDICYFGVTEMLNNAIDHSRGSKITLETKFSDPILTIIVKDDGVGVFKTICDYLQIDDIREGILHLSKGKITRDPANHTGQGIFFTSRMFDTFVIDANGYVYTKDNHLQDWTFVQRYGSKGTEITMTININAQTTCKQVFSAYEGKDYAFDKTEILVHLSDFKEDNFISRSQAKRILLGLEKFSLITFDFKRIEFIGQGFVDEIFRIFKNAHPEIKVQYINANDAVRFMIERSGNTK